MAGSWNQNNRRMAKLRSKSNWFKGKEEIPGPEEENMETDLPEGRQDDLPEGRKNDQMEKEEPDSQGGRKEGTDNPAEKEDPDSLEEEQQVPGAEKETLPEGRRRTKRPKLEVKGKKRGQNRQSQTLGGIKQTREGIEKENHK